MEKQKNGKPEDLETQAKRRLEEINNPILAILLILLISVGGFFIYLNKVRVDKAAEKCEEKNEKLMLQNDTLHMKLEDSKNITETYKILYQIQLELNKQNELDRFIKNKKDVKYLKAIDNQLKKQVDK